MDIVSALEPEYVWLTSGVGRWTNEVSAEALAKRAAGIDIFKIVKVMRLVNTPLKLIGREEFIERSRGTKYAYMYGGVQQLEDGETANGSVSVITTDSWSGLSFDIHIGEKKTVPFSERSVVADFELQHTGISPRPFTKLESLRRKDPRTNYCLIIGAMVIGKPKT